MFDEKNMRKHYRVSSTGKIWSIHRLKMQFCTESGMGTKIICGMCGKKASAGYHLTTATKFSGTKGYCWRAFHPLEALLGLEYYQTDEFRQTLHWFVNDCCRAQFRRDCFDLGFKIDREKTSHSYKKELERMKTYLIQQGLIQV